MKRTIILTALLFMTLCAVVLIIHQINSMIHEKESIKYFRSQVFCVDIQPNMSRVEAETILKTHGIYNSTETSFNNTEFLVIHFIDPKTNRQFGGKPIGLRFDQDKYYNAYISKFNSDSSQPLCEWPR
jgi:hypothetical protein